MDHDLNFGHGFIPRIGRQNYKAVDRCLGPDTLFDEPIDLPWVFVDAPWAEKDPDFLASLRDHGTNVLLDDSGWRYRYAATFDVASMAKASWAPDAPLQIEDQTSFRRYIHDTLVAQAMLGADAYFVPGLMPDNRHEDLRPTYEFITSVVSSLDGLAAKPMMLFLGAHSSGLALAHTLLDELPGFLSGIYLQVGPIAPVTDSPTKLLHLTEICQHAKDLGIAVIAGHAGAITPALRSAGIEAADAGLATSEAFTPSTARHEQPTADADNRHDGGPSSRIYVEALGRSFDATRINELRSVPAVRDLISGCRLPCHRFIGGDDYLTRAKEHTLRARIADAQAINQLPSSMRLGEMLERLTRQRSTVTSVNAALKASGLDPVDTRPTDNHLNWIARLTETSSAA